MNLIGSVLGAIFVCAAIAAAESAPDQPALWTPQAISTPGYESSPTFSPDGREMYYVAADAAFSRYRIMRSTCANARWSAPEPAVFAAPPPAIEADPGITPDGQRLYFISTRHDPKNEDFDIWMVDRRRDGTWSAPVRLPNPVNSPGAELLPRVDDRGNLYFGSDRAGGYGQSDIYRARDIGGGRWKVSNVGPPVSTAANEYEGEIARDGRTLVVVADRGDRSHLYRYQLRQGPWLETGRVSARTDVFQVGPLLSPKADRLLFAQAQGIRSGEMFLVDLKSDPDPHWPPTCR